MPHPHDIHSLDLSYYYLTAYASTASAMSLAGVYWQRPNLLLARIVFWNFSLNVCVSFAESSSEMLAYYYLVKLICLESSASATPRHPWA